MISNENLQRDFDLVVVGSGAAGIHAAIQAAKIHKRVCIVERNPHRIGGSWIHTGTIPSKTLREGLAAVYSLQEHMGKAWVERLVQDLQAGQLIQHARQVGEQEEANLQEYIRNNQIQILHGDAFIENAYSVRVNAQSHSKLISTNFIFIATGSQPDRPEYIAFDGWRVIDSDDIFNLEALPKTMVIYGAGVIGCEYACIFAALGVEVTLVHGRVEILPYCDREIIGELQSIMGHLGVRFKLGTRIIQAQSHGPHVKMQLGDDILESDLLLWTAGRNPQSQHLGLEALGIDVDERRAIKVNENFQTVIPSIYAGGDVVGSPALAATAVQQGRFVACHAFGSSLGSFPKDYPIGIYTIPECSMVGKTEEALVKEGRDYVVGRAYYKEIARSIMGGQTHGLLKILIDKKTHEILGVHIVGDDACNLVHIGLAFMTKNGRAQDFVNMVFNYPTLAEGYRIAAFNGLNKIFTDGVIKAPPFERRKNAYSSIKS